MDLLRVLARVRPDVSWTGSMVNAFSKETIRETYESESPFPTDQEIAEAWAIIQAEDEAESARIKEIEQAVNSSEMINMSLKDGSQFIDQLFHHGMTADEIALSLNAVLKDFLPLIQSARIKR